MAKKDPYLKVKVVEVSSRKLFGRPSEMEKTIEKWVNQGWELAKRQKVRNKNRYTLTFTYRMSEEELEAQRKRQRNTGIGCLAIVGILIVISSINSSQRAASLAATQTFVAQARGTEIAQKIATGTQQSVNDTATATLWTPTNTPTASDTPTQTDTPTITLTPSITFTPSNTPILSATPTIMDTVPVPTATPRPPTSAPAETYYVQREANARVCPRLDCESVAVLQVGAQVSVIGWQQGDRVSNNDIWYRAQYNGREVYIHSGLLANAPPRPTSAPQQVVPPPISTVPQPPPPVAASGCSCVPDLDCPDFSTHTEAQVCFNKCMAEVGRDVHGLDGNDNGLACESLP